jgi:radical SAM/Cys-rich protein
MGAGLSSAASEQTPTNPSQAVEPFSATLSQHGLELKRDQTTTLQINVGLLCNQVCKHCHLEAGPGRTELMDRKTVEHVVAFAERASFQVADITGGATELNPHLSEMIERLSPLVKTVMIRSNLTNLADGKKDLLLDVFTRNGVVIVASFPSTNAAQVKAQRGEGTLERSVEVLRKLNSLGYGQPDSGLQIDLVANPTGAFLPAAQETLEKKFRRDLERKWGLVFNNLFTFANVPLGRFRKWLKQSGNFDGYMAKLAAAFNPCTVTGLMCRTLISVSWDGYLYDCDFNLAAGLPSGGTGHHVSEMNGPPKPATAIAVSDHCYACTAGSGFT